MSNKKWTTKDGQEIEYKDLEDYHLLNIIKFVERTVKSGIKCKRKEYFDCGYDGDSYMPDFIWFESVLTEREGLKYFDLIGLKKEAIKRKLI
jgi:hypothetical protein